MTIPRTVRDYLMANEVRFEVIDHRRTITSRDAATVAHVPAAQMAKAVVLRDEHAHPLLAVLASDRHVHIDKLERLTGHKLELAEETWVAPHFSDCEFGAVPAVGLAYGVQTAVDDSVRSLDDVYFEAGDHTELIHMDGEDFDRLQMRALHGDFSR